MNRRNFIAKLVGGVVGAAMCCRLELAKPFELLAVGNRLGKTNLTFQVELYKTLYGTVTFMKHPLFDDPENLPN